MMLTISRASGARDAPVEIAGPPDLQAILEHALSRLRRHLPAIEMRIASHRAIDTGPESDTAVRIAHASLAPGASTSPIGIVVHTANPLRSFPLERLARLFTQRDAACWGDLGLCGAWADRPLRLYGLRGIDQQRLPPGFPGSADCATADGAFGSSAEVVAAIKADPDGIGLACLNQVSAPVRALGLIDAERRFHWPTPAEIRSGQYPFDRFLTVQSPRAADDRLAAVHDRLIDFLLSRAGRSALAARPHRYIPLNRVERARELAKLKRGA